MVSLGAACPLNPWPVPLHPTHRSDPRSRTPFPKLELGLGPRPTAPRELPACSICLERLREPVSLDCGHDFCTRCFSTHRVPGCEPPCCPECRKICKQKKGLRSLGEKMKLLPQKSLPPVLQVRGPGLTAEWGAQRDPGPIPEEAGGFGPILECRGGNRVQGWTHCRLGSRRPKLDAQGPSSSWPRRPVP